MEKARKEMLQSLAAVSDAMQTFVSSQKKFTAALAELDISLKADDTEGAKRKRVAKTPKDPDAPKRPASSYLLFQNEMRAQFKEQHPDMNHNDVVKQLSARWSSMTPEDKTVWNNRSDALKKKYNVEYAAYVAKHPEIDLEKKNAKKEKSAPAKSAQPAKAPSAKPPSKKPVAAVPAVATTSTDPSSESSEESSDEDAPVKKQQQQQDSSGEEESDDEDEQESSEEEEIPEPVKKKAKVESSKRK